MNPRRGRLVTLALQARRTTRRHGVRRLGGIVIVALAVMMTFPVASATSGALITGRQIKDGTVTGRDVRNDSIPAREFGHLPPGPAGPQGPQGVPGPQGATGSPGTSGWATIVSENGVTIAAGDTASAQVSCPAGVAVGGGAGVSVPAFSSLVESAPLDFDGTGWVVTVRNIAPQGQPVTVFAWAVCVTR